MELNPSNMKLYLWLKYPCYNLNNSLPFTNVFVTLPWSFLSSIDVFFDFEISLSFFTIHGLSISTIQRSASLPIDRFPLFIFNILAGFDVNAFIIVSNLSDPLWYNSKLRDSKVSIPDAPVAAWANVNLFDSSSSGLWSETITSVSYTHLTLPTKVYV